jgi:phosphomannomutase
VSNLSSTRALRDITEKHGGEYFASAVGEVNVVEKMKEVGAIIGGEGNGGIIYPELHYGRDALVGIALFLSFLANSKDKSCRTVSELRNKYPNLYISKNKIELSPDTDIDVLLQKVIDKFNDIGEVSTIDGVKIDLPDGWIHIRKSNTEAIIRIYAEGESEKHANELYERINAVIAVAMQ